MIEGPIHIGDIMRSPGGHLYRVCSAGPFRIVMDAIDKDGAITHHAFLWTREEVVDRHTRIEMPPYERYES